VDRHHFAARPDLDPTFYFDADPDPDFFFTFEHGIASLHCSSFFSVS
jgi:hypothetical protein